MTRSETVGERQTRLRIRLSVASWAYEHHNTSIMSDHEFDRLCLEVDTAISTGNRKMDNFFRNHFDPSTGQWVNRHPEKGGLENILLRHFPGFLDPAYVEKYLPCKTKKIG